MNPTDPDAASLEFQDQFSRQDELRSGILNGRRAFIAGALFESHGRRHAVLFRIFGTIFLDQAAMMYMKQIQYHLSDSDGSSRVRHAFIHRSKSGESASAFSRPCGLNPGGRADRIF